MYLSWPKNAQIHCPAMFLPLFVMELFLLKRKFIQIREGDEMSQKKKLFSFLDSSNLIS